MEKRKFILTSLFIVGSILLTVGFQAYWNYKNYQENKRSLISELQTVLDNSLEEYFASTARRRINIVEKEAAINRIPLDKMDSIRVLRNPNIKGLKHIWIDTGEVNFTVIDRKSMSPSSLELWSRFEAGDSVKIGRDVSKMASRIIVSLTEDSLNINKVDSIFENQLAQRNINISYTLAQAERLPFSPDEPKQNTLYATSSFLTGGGNIKVTYDDLTVNVLKRSLAGISISLLITVFISISLLYLYRIIRDQKELSLIKNDLINNITHEFKTPIATTLTALEGIKSFNKESDPVKTEKYIDISTMQLHKLTEMVEKLLETATLDSNGVVIKKDKIEISELLRKLKNRFEVITEKHIGIELEDNIIVQADPFHLENAIANLVDNAVKYGGKNIVLKAYRPDRLIIEVSDDGGKIKPAYRDKIFDKFYRISTGNIHDVKGFGIGLYYTKKIVQQHGGEVRLEVNDGITTFKVELT